MITKTSFNSNEEKQSLTEVFEGENLSNKTLLCNRPEENEIKEIIAINGKTKIFKLIVTKENFGFGLSQVINFIKEGERKGYIELADSYSITK